MRVCAITLAGVLAFMSFFVRITPQNSDAAVVYSYEETEKEKTFIINYAGYSYKIPYGFLVNKDYISLRLRLESENTIIEIYNETESEPESYINYTNEAITTAVGMQDVELSEMKYDNKPVYKLKWKREKLARIENDKNYYVKFDIQNEGSVCTIFVKSSKEITDAESYLNNITFINKGVFTEDYVKSLDKKITASAKNWNEETNAVYNSLFKEEGLTWGIFSPVYSDFKDGLAEYESKIDYKFEAVLHYTAIYEEYNPSVGEFLQNAYNDGRIVELTLQPPGNSIPANMMYDVLNGEYDDFLRDYAAAVKDFGHPVLLRLYNEMNGDWCEYSSYQMSADTDLVNAVYNYTASFFEDADNVIFVWNPNGKSFPDFDWNDALLLQPESKYIDVIGLTMYNTGNYYEGENWTSFADLYENLYNDMSKRTDLPMMITEFSSARAGGDKEAWTEDMFSKIKEYKNIKIAIWWNHADFDAAGNIARSYYIDDSEKMIEIFKRNIKN